MTTAATASESHQERFSKMTRILFDRSLQNMWNETSTLAPTPSFGGGGDGSGSGGFPTTPTTGGMSPPAPSPTSGSPSSTEDQGSDFERAQPLIFLILILLVLFIAYKIYRTCRQRREQYLMRLRSVQADQVLGDMQMVPSEDPDAELL